MAKKNKIKKIIILVDYENIAMEAAAIGKVPDWSEFIKKILEEENIEIAFAFMFIPDHKILMNFPVDVTNAGFYPIATSRSVKDKDQVDAVMTDLGTRFLEHSDVDILVIVSGDGDFTRLANNARFKKKEILVFSGNNLSFFLKQVVSATHNMPFKNKR